MASTGRSLRAVEMVVSALLVTIGVLGLLGRTDMLVTRLNQAGSWIQLWPLVLVLLGAWQLALYMAKKQPSRK